MLSDVVEEVVLEHGGEVNVIYVSPILPLYPCAIQKQFLVLNRIWTYIQVVVAEKAMKGDLQEKLTMTVAVPLLWGVPPASETLHLAVKSGGGIVEKVYWQWNFL